MNWGVRKLQKLLLRFTLSYEAVSKCKITNILSLDSFKTAFIFILRYSLNEVKNLEIYCLDAKILHYVQDDIAF